MDENLLSHEIIGAAIDVHWVLGPGLLESVYEEALCFELNRRGLTVESQVTVPLIFKGHTLSKKLYLDILVNNQIIIELKSVQRIEDVYKKQLLTYLRLSQKRLGLLINFNESLLKNGISRIINSKT